MTQITAITFEQSVRHQIFRKFSCCLVSREFIQCMSWLCSEHGCSNLQSCQVTHFFTFQRINYYHFNCKCHCRIAFGCSDQRCYQNFQTYLYLYWPKIYSIIDQIFLYHFRHSQKLECSPQHQFDQAIYSQIQMHQEYCYHSWYCYSLCHFETAIDHSKKEPQNHLLNYYYYYFQCSWWYYCFPFSYPARCGRNQQMYCCCYCCCLLYSFTYPQCYQSYLGKTNRNPFYSIDLLTLSTYILLKTSIKERI